MNNRLLFTTSFFFVVPLTMAFYMASYDVAASCALCCISSAANYYSGNAYVKLVDIMVVTFLAAFYNVSSWSLFHRDRRFASIWLISLIISLLFFLDSYCNDHSHVIVHLLASIGLCIFTYLKTRCHGNFNVFTADRNVDDRWQLPNHPFHPLYSSQKDEYMRCYCMHHYGGAFLTCISRLNLITKENIDTITLNDDLWVILLDTEGSLICKSDTPFTKDWMQLVCERLDNSQSSDIAEVFIEVCDKYADHVWRP